MADDTSASGGAGSGSDKAQRIAAGYATDGGALELGTVVVDGQVDPAARVRIPLAMLNRHGLVAGATGTGKTKTLQALAGQLSDAGVPVFLADVKGDLSGMSRPGEDNPRVRTRATDTGDDWTPTAYPVEFLSLGDKSSATPIRATLTQFGPILLSKVLDLNDTQESTLGLIFHWADQRNLPLLDTKDLRAVIQHLTSDEGKADLKGIGGVSSATAGVILRALVNLEAAGGDDFFGEPEFDPADLLRIVDGKGIVTLLELADQSGNPRLFSTFLMWLLAELFEDLPEAGDLDKPKLVFFFDEAHLLFTDAQQGVPGADRADGQADPVQGHRRVLLHPAAHRHPERRAQPARRPRAARPARVHPGGPGGAGQDRQDLPEHRRTTTSRRRSPRWASARRSSRCSPSGARRRRWRGRGSGRRAR